MDPNESLARLFRHLTDGNVQDAQRYLGYLKDWMADGGFAPDEEATLTILKSGRVD